MNKKYLLQEDDCAPDAREYFIKEMKSKYNLDFNDFKKHGVLHEPDNLTMILEYKGFCLEYHGDDPVFKLSKYKNVSRETINQEGEK